MTKFILTILAAVWMAAGAVRAQQAWVQIEALPTLAEAENRARAWSSAFPDVNGYRLASGWYAIALGPFAAAEATDRLFALRAERLVPQDSFIADGGAFRAQFWPVGAEPASQPSQVQSAQQQPVPGEGAAPAAQAQPPAGQVAAVAPPSVAPPAVVIPEETPAEARRSEAALSAEERMALQTAMQWFGFYDGAIDGAFGRGTRTSMAAWQGANLSLIHI